MMTENGDLFTWGKNRDCQLGVQGLMDTEMLPILVTLTPEDEQVESRYQAIAVAAGAHHGMSLVLRTKTCY
jgi:alpha-tubulin suppressor-like RCC1 family protein